MTNMTARVKAAKIRSAPPQTLKAIKKGLVELDEYDWYDCRGIVRAIAEKSGDKELAHEVSRYLSELAQLGLIEYKTVWDRGRRFHYRSTTTSASFDKALGEKKKKKKPKCCDAQKLVKLKSGRKKCKNCGKKFGKKKKKEPSK